MEDQLTDENTPPEQHINSITSENIQIEILKLLQSMQSTLKQHNNKSSNNSNNNGKKKKEKRFEGRTEKYF